RGIGGAPGRPRWLDPAHHPRSPSARLPSGRAHPGPTGGRPPLVALASFAPSPSDAQSLPSSPTHATGEDVVLDNPRQRPTRSQRTRGCRGREVGLWSAETQSALLTS